MIGYWQIWKDKNFLLRAVAGVLCLLASLVFYVYAAGFATANQGPAVGDILLNHLPILNTTWIFIWAALLVIFLSVILSFAQPERLPFIAKSAALFIFIRSIFLSLTHLGAPASLPFSSGLMHTVNFSGDLFFSGHAGMPFLMALIFWQQKFWRSVFLALSVLLAAGVLLGHLHYTIDVAAAYFITPTIFVLSKKLFSKDFSKI